MKPQQKKRHRDGAPAGGSPERLSAGMREKPGNLMVLATIASVILAALLGVGVLSPLLFTAAVFPFFYDSLKRGEHHTGIFLVFRWGVALFVTLLAVGAFVPNRLGAALPLSDSAVRAVESWIREPQAPAPAGTGYLFWGMLAFLAGTFVSGGLAGFIIGSVALGGAACAALYIIRHGYNLFQVALVALPAWQLGLFIAGAFLVVPASVFMFERFLHPEQRIEDRTRLRQYMYAGAGFFVLSVLLRYTVAGPWRSLLEKWTVH